MKRITKGFSLVEILIAIAIFSGLVAAVGPSFTGLFNTNKLNSARDNLMSSLQLAKSEAIRRNKAVAICPSTNGTACSGSEDWSEGWIVYEDSGSGTTSTVDTILRVQTEIEKINVIHSGHRNTLNPDLFIRYVSQGFASDSSPIPAQTVGFCDQNKYVEAKVLIITQTTGQVRPGIDSDVVCP